ncbi:unnamed protein product [Bursaphelenchus okinawaensis]|uniref:Tyrosine-protein phosphatase domain-containing protein n=1 Tax=Bursaphelenchus okinawaensis TaxID=465554 RepID=A0A811L987_9BILA|nr:unnamed protein product [Bursaphelenchus okinawaensis]CAG9119784.1 unnamed protein product [Bursaphelenchus okinawaensis]
MKDLKTRLNEMKKKYSRKGDDAEKTAEENNRGVSVKEKRKRRTTASAKRRSGATTQDVTETVDSSTKVKRTSSADKSQKRSRKKKATKEEGNVSVKEKRKPKDNHEKPEKDKEEIIPDKNGYVTWLLDKDMPGLKKEFQELATENVNPSATAGLDGDNASKNRYKTVQCIEESRVKLSDGGYYNANSVDSKFILAQSPLASTVANFWDLAQTEGVDVIVQMTPCDDGKKCGTYYKPGESGEFGGIKVATTKPDAIASDDQNVQVSVIKAETPKGEVNAKHIFWSNFPVVGFPEASSAVFHIWRATRHAKKVLVHCACGSGRSAVVVLGCQGIDRLYAGQEVALLKLAKELRQKRHLAIKCEMHYIYTARILLFTLMKSNSVEMSQNLLMFIDDYDSYAKKYANEEKEKRKKAPKYDAGECSED